MKAEYVFNGHKVPITLKAEARQQHFRRLTFPYNTDKEKEMLDRALNDLIRSGIDCCLVRTMDGLEIWRAKPCGKQ